MSNPVAPFLLAGGDPGWNALREPGSIAFVKPPARHDEARGYHKKKQEAQKQPDEESK